MPKGIYKRKNKTNLPALAQEIPLEAIPDRSPPVIRVPKASLEMHLVNITHRLLNQNDRLMTMVETLHTTNRKVRGPNKKKRK